VAQSPAHHERLELEPAGRYMVGRKAARYAMQYRFLRQATEPAHQPAVGRDPVESFRVAGDGLTHLEEGVPRRHPHSAPNERVPRRNLKIEAGARCLAPGRSEEHT